MMRAQRIRVYPNKTQQKRIDETLELHRQVYNELLDLRIKTYKETGKTLCRTELRKHLPKVVGHSIQLRAVSRRLDLAFEAFFRRCKDPIEKKKGFPRHKKFGKLRSITKDQQLRIKGNLVYFPDIGRLKLTEPVKGKPKTMCLKKEPSGKYHLTFLSEVEVIPILAPDKAIGIDLGITHAIATSDGQFFDSPKPLKANLAKLRREQRSFSRKKKGSKNREKQRIRVARCHEKIADIRQDWTHQVSTFLTRNYRTIVCEELNIQNMLKNRKLARAISDIGWGCLKQKISYKASSAGGKLVEVNPYNTSQLCSACGQLVPKTLNERTHNCQNCGLVLDRDVNAAINILNRGIGRATPKFKPDREDVRPVHRHGLFSLTQEAYRAIA